MFSENQKLSDNGIRKMIITEEIGLIFLFSTYFAEQLDILTGFGIFTAIFVFSLGYLFLVFRILKKQEQGFPCSAKLQFFIKWKTKIKGFLLTGFGVLMLIKYVHEQLLPGTHILFIGAMIYLCVFLIARKETEIRGRLCELLYPFVIVPILAVIVYEVFCIDYHNFFSTFLGNLLPEYDLTGRNFLKLFLTAFFSFLILSPWGYLLSKTPFFHQTEQAKKCFLKTSLFLYLLCIIQFLISKLTYHVNPVLSVVISLIMYIATQLHYGLPGKKALSCGYTLAAFVFSSILLVLPATLSSSHLYTYLSRADFHRLYESKAKFIDARELENRSFVLSMVISEEQGTPLYLCELADYSAGAGQLSSMYMKVTNLEDYPLAGGKPLDFSHIRAIVIDDSVENFTETDFYELTDQYRIPGTTLIFQKKDFPQTFDHLMAELEDIGLGEVLSTLAENQNIHKELMLRNLTSH